MNELTCNFSKSMNELVNPHESRDTAATNFTSWSDTLMLVPIVAPKELIPLAVYKPHLDELVPHFQIIVVACRK